MLITWHNDADEKDDDHVGVDECCDARVCRFGEMQRQVQCSGRRRYHYLNGFSTRSPCWQQILTRLLCSACSKFLKTAVFDIIERKLLSIVVNFSWQHIHLLWSECSKILKTAAFEIIWCPFWSIVIGNISLIIICLLLSNCCKKSSSPTHLFSYENFLNVTTLTATIQYIQTVVKIFYLFNASHLHMRMHETVPF